MTSLQTKLSTLWIFATLNYLYCDVVTLMDPRKLHGFLTGSIGGIDITQQFLLAAGALVEVPMAMVLVSRFARGRANRIANLVAGAFMTIVQLGTLLAGPPAPYYLFFSLIEVAATGAIIAVAAFSFRSARRVADSELSDAA